jgi:hypothetical protein
VCPRAHRIALLTVKEIGHQAAKTPGIREASKEIIMSRASLKLLGIGLAAALGASSVLAAAPLGSIALDGGLRISITEAGRTEVIVPNDVEVSSEDITVEVAQGFAGIILTDLDDDSGFTLRAIRYPETGTFGSSYVSTAIEVAEEDAKESTYPGGPSSRNCNSDCRLPAGTYTLLAITEDGVGASLGLDLGDGTTSVTDEQLTPIRIEVSSPKAIAEDFDTVESRSGGWATSTLANRGRALAFQQVNTNTSSTGAGTVYVEHCFTVDGTCVGNYSFSLYHPTAATPDGGTAFITAELPAGAHGSSVRFSVTAAGGGSVTIVTDTLRVYPG